MVKVTPHGEYANIVFHTNIAGIATVQVAEVAPKTLAYGTLSYSNMTTEVSPSPPRSTSTRWNCRT